MVSLSDCVFLVVPLLHLWFPSTLSHDYLHGEYLLGYHRDREYHLVREASVISSQENEFLNVTSLTCVLFVFVLVVLLPAILIVVRDSLWYTGSTSDILQLPTITSRKHVFQHGV